MSKLISVILARGGSKGVPGKNIKKIKNIPLLGYPILASKKTKYISDIYVSTDDDEIKEVALEYGANVIDRPSEFAQDDSLDIDAMRHAVEYLQSYDDIVHLIMGERFLQIQYEMQQQQQMMMQQQRGGF